jgi:hypothetical protein
VTTKVGRAHMAPEFEDAIWKKSSYSGGSEGQCVEYADATHTHSGIAVRDSKHPEGPALLFTTQAFYGFVAAVGKNELHLS